MWNRSELKQNAKDILKRNYWKVFLASAIFYIMAYLSRYISRIEDVLLTNSDTILMIFISFIIVILIYICFKTFIENPFLVGAQKLLLNCKDDNAQNNDIFFAFKNSYLNIVKTLFIQGLLTDLFMLLFIIPGIIKTYEYRMVPYLLVERPDMDWKEALNTSKEMMNGQKWNAFVLDMSFIGWHLLGLLTCGIVEAFYARPYSLLTNAELYCTLKEV